MKNGGKIMITRYFLSLCVCRKHDTKSLYFYQFCWKSCLNSKEQTIRIYGKDITIIKSSNKYNVFI